MEAYKRLKRDIVGKRLRQIEIAHNLEWDPSLLSKYLNGWRPMTKEVEDKIRKTIKNLTK